MKQPFFSKGWFMVLAMEMDFDDLFLMSTDTSIYHLIPTSFIFLKADLHQPYKLHNVNASSYLQEICAESFFREVISKLHTLNFFRSCRKLNPFLLLQCKLEQAAKSADQNNF